MKESKQKNPGVKEIARKANVSIATVDRVLHNRPGVSPSTKRKIDRIIKELDFKPNIIASRLASNRIFNFVVLIPSVSDDTDFWAAPLNGTLRAERELMGYGIKISRYFFDLNDRKSFEKQADKILENKVDGIVLSPSFINEARQFTSLCKSKKIPYVLIDSNIPREEGLCYIGPHLFRSGYVGAQLVNFTLRSESDILVINIAHELDDHNYLSEIEEGFRAYFRYNNLYNHILKKEIKYPDFASLVNDLDQIFKGNHPPKSIFVTNSRVYAIAHYFENYRGDRPFLIGYDFINKNVEYLKGGFIDVLLCHKPEEQGYRGIIALYRHLILGEEIESIHFMPIDIITKENYEFYTN